MSGLVKKIDMHAHTVRMLPIPRPDGSNYATPSEICKIYDKIGVEKGVLLPEITPDGICSTTNNEDIYEIVSAFPENFSWFCNIDPRFDANSKNTDFGYFLKYYKALGAKGVGEITANLYFDDERVFALFKACEEYDMPVIFHMGHTNGEYGLIDELNLPRLEKALATFPKLKFLGHSPRFWSHIGGDVNENTRHGFPSGKVVPGGRVVELMRKYPNLCGDLSSGSGYNALIRDKEFAYSFMEEFKDRLYYATDICDSAFISRESIKLASFLDEAVTDEKISYETYYKISRGNALEILNK